MVRILIVTALSILATGCASTPTEGSYGKMLALGFISPQLAGEEAVKLGLAKRPIDQAISNCKQIGYRQGTDEFNQCAMVTANNISNNRAQQAAADDLARSIRSTNFRNTTTQCRQVGSVIQCQQF